jgi:hypothetical protein
MDRTETQTHSFIVRIWIEEDGEQAEEVLWRGHVTHVPSGRRQYIQALKEICTFIAAYLEAMGIGGSSLECADGVNGRVEEQR